MHHFSILAKKKKPEEVEKHSLISRGSKTMLSDKAATPVSVAQVLLKV